MQGSKQDTFVKTQKKQKRFDDGTGKQQNAKKHGNYHKQQRTQNQEH